MYCTRSADESKETSRNGTVFPKLYNKEKPKLAMYVRILLINGKGTNNRHRLRPFHLILTPKGDIFILKPIGVISNEWRSSCGNKANVAGNPQNDCAECPH